MSDQTNKLIEPVIEIAVQAGEKIKEIYRSDFSVNHKEDNSPVTMADISSNEIILKALADLPNNYPVLSEEAELVDFATRCKWPRFWLVDPLDGTRDFIEKKDSFCINIGLVNNHEMVLGVVHVPMQNKTYYACRGHGAFVVSENGPAQGIGVQTWQGDRPFKIATSRSHPSGMLPKFLEQIGDCETIQLGSAAKMCMVAAGEVDFYPRFGPTWEWDTAAAQCIVEEAGGRLTNLQFHPLKYNNRESLKNPSFLAFGNIGDQGEARIKKAISNIELTWK